MTFAWRELLDFRRAHTGKLTLCGAWGGKTDGCGNPGIYLVEEGPLFVHVDGASIELHSGDALLLPRSRAHTLQNHPASHIEPVEQLRARSVVEGTSLHYGSCGPPVRFLSAAFSGSHPSLDWFPSSILLAASHRDRCTHHVLNALRHELHRGNDELVCGLAEVLFAKTFEVSWPGPQPDGAILRAVAHAQQNPRAFSDVASWSRSVGLSPSRFTERFVAVFREPPMRWRRRLHMRQAHSALLTGDVSVAQVAAELGYASETAFRKAFRRTMGFSAKAGKPKPP